VAATGPPGSASGYSANLEAPSVNQMWSDGSPPRSSPPIVSVQRAGPSPPNTSPTKRPAQEGQGPECVWEERLA
jgi:hypothetical protein